MPKNIFNGSSTPTPPENQLVVALNPESGAFDLVPVKDTIPQTTDGGSFSLEYSHGN